ALAGPHGIAGATRRRNLLAVSALNRFVDAQHPGLVASKGPDEQMQQDPTSTQARPDGPLEHAVIRLEGRPIRPADGPPGRTAHPAAGGEDRTGEEDGDLPPGSTREERRKVA